MQRLVQFAGRQSVLAAGVAARQASTGPSGKKYFDKIMVANRGEIACRVFRTAKKLGIKTVAVYSEADKDAVHVQAADEAVCIGPAPTNQSYLNMDAVLEAAKKTGAQAVHPGYGFLSENADFSRACATNGIAFVGPPPDAMYKLGDKIRSKLLARSAGVSTVPGYAGEVNDVAEATKISREIGYPVMLKASHGGGGKGMRVAWNDKDVKENYAISREEAKSFFGDDRLLIEKFVENPRHIEIQVIADQQGNVIFFPERECSLQRRNQKVVEESPSLALDDALRRAMGEQAASLARAVGYYSAGTLEFLFDIHKKFFFLEMNTRLQVEHPVTEYITGYDLVELMIMIAAGHPLPMKQSDIKINGWAMETRIYAEDPLKGFLPSIGTLTTYREPEVDNNLRIDTGVREGSEISVYYDPMISKVIAHGANRSEALVGLRDALDSFVVRGVNHNVNFLRSVLDHPRFQRGDLSTSFIPEEYPQGFKGHPLNAKQLKQLIASTAVMHMMRVERNNTISGRLGSAMMPEKLDLVVEVAGQRYEVMVASDPASDQLGGAPYAVGIATEIKAMEGAFPEVKETTTAAAKKDTDAPSAADEHENNGDEHVFEVMPDWSIDSPLFRAYMLGDEHPVVVQLLKTLQAGYRMQHIGNQFDVKVMSPAEAQLIQYMPEKAAIDTSKMLLSPMPGALRHIYVAEGDAVAPGQPLAVVEAMKMQNILRAVNAGTVKKIRHKLGDVLAADELIMELE